MNRKAKRRKPTECKQLRIRFKNRPTQAMVLDAIRTAHQSKSKSGPTGDWPPSPELHHAHVSSATFSPPLPSTSGR